MNSTNFDRLLRQVVVVPVCALLLTAGIALSQILSFDRTVAAIERSDSLIANTIAIEGLVVDQETGLRGYQLTGERVFLEPYKNSNSNLHRRLAELQAAEETAGDRQKAANLEEEYDIWINSFALPLIKEVESGESSLDPALTLQGKRQMDAIRSQISSLTEAAEKRRDSRIRYWSTQLRDRSLGFVLFAVTIGLLIGLYVRRLLKLVSSAYRQSHQALRIRAEQTFRSEEKLRTTVESIGDGVITCDAEGRIQTMNTVARELTGWKTEEALHKPLAEVFRLINEVGRDPAESPFEKVKRMDRTVSLANQTILIRRDGTEIFIDDSGAPIRDKMGRLIGIVLVFRDITLAKKSRDALLANEKLAVAGRLAASIAHEIHNPLDSVSNLLFLMAGTTTAAESQQFLDLARQEIARVTQISRAMLSLYRESRTPVSIELKEMIDSILVLMDGRFRTLGVSVSANLPAGLTVRGFPAELRQVFTNLLINAAEATERGTTVEITARSTPPAILPEGLSRPAGAVVMIADHGPGIEPSVREKLFNPFFSTKGEQGTGLGLWISKGIVTKHGGSIELSSRAPAEDHGTVATVFLACDPPFSALAL